MFLIISFFSIAQINLMNSLFYVKKHSKMEKTIMRIGVI